MMCDVVLLAIHQSGVAEAHTWEEEEAVAELGSSRQIQAPYFEFQGVIISRLCVFHLLPLCSR